MMNVRVVVVVFGVVYPNSSSNSSRINSSNRNSGGGNFQRSPLREGCHSIFVWFTEPMDAKYTMCACCVWTPMQLCLQSPCGHGLNRRYAPARPPAIWDWPGVPGGTVPSLTAPSIEGSANPVTQECCTLAGQRPAHACNNFTHAGTALQSQSLNPCCA